MLAVAVGYLVVLGGGAWALSVGLGEPIGGSDYAAWLAPVMIIAAVVGWLVVLLWLPEGVTGVSRYLLPAVGAGGAFLLAALVLHGLGSGDPLKGPALALAQFGYPTVYLAVALACVATATVGMGTSPHRDAEGRNRPIV
ncbi:hypothetical protein [Mycetocola zhujimingii]|uniref:Uncharacterized protein n=1 Tax=Mycetocola zhujimingii TaxID=2079792 RepID=A0A2U1TB44_9MICO|nr:hypothetical protein [Mycetocola zhujimingii]PWC06096.1 hypothetical protein DF223_13145 [Mycetocola zhujimingii]